MIELIAVGLTFVITLINSLLILQGRQKPSNGKNYVSQAEMRLLISDRDAWRSDINRRLEEMSDDTKEVRRAIDQLRVEIAKYLAKQA